LSQQPRFFFEPFDKKKHNRADFSCEHERLVTYLQQQASQEIKKRVAAVFILTPDGKTIAGFYTLSQYAVDAGELPERLMKDLGLPKYPQLPATLLGRLARSLEFRGQGVGELLLMGALKRALDHSKAVASVAVVTDAKDEAAKAFYERYGFIKLPAPANRLFLPMKTIEEMFISNHARAGS
jgi:predicted GNAT family N-acyltransferase